jgi:hypothetical protein
MSTCTPRFAQTDDVVCMSLEKLFLCEKKNQVRREQAALFCETGGVRFSDNLHSFVKHCGLSNETGQNLFSLPFQKLLQSCRISGAVRLPQQIFLRSDVCITLTSADDSNDGIQVVLWRFFQSSAEHDASSAAATKLEQPLHGECFEEHFTTSKRQRFGNESI